MTRRFQIKTVLVTGGISGTGGTIALWFAEEGANAAPWPVSGESSYVNGIGMAPDGGGTP